MKIYTLEVFIIGGPIAEEFAKKNPVISRTIEIRGDQTLEVLHHVIFRAFNREDEHMYEFQVGGKGPHDPKARRYGLGAYMDAVFGESKIHADVKHTTMDSLKLKMNEAFGYWFDFGDDWWHQINVLSIDDQSPKGRYPKVTKRIGKSPPQYPDFDEEDE
jgi:hypothetical protein